MDIEVKRMSSTAIEMLDQLSAVCKQFGVDYYAASQNQRDLLDSIALHEYQLKKAHERGVETRRCSAISWLEAHRTQQRDACIKFRVLWTMLHQNNPTHSSRVFLFWWTVQGSNRAALRFPACKFHFIGGVLSLASVIYLA